MNFWRSRIYASTSHVPCRLVFAGLFLVLVASVASPAHVQAQGSDDLRVMLDRMQRLERDIRTLNLQLSRGRPVIATPAPVSPKPRPPPAAEEFAAEGPALARMGVRLTALESDLRMATGGMEDISFQIGEIRQRLDKLVADMDYRLNVLEGRPPGKRPGKSPGPPRLSAAPSPPPVQKIIPGQRGNQSGGFAEAASNLGTVSQKVVSAITPSQGDDKADNKISRAAKKPVQAAPAPAQQAAANVSSILPQGTPREQYNYAFGLLRQANYDKAEMALQEFVKLHPKETLVSNARYWLGETYYVRAAYVQAAEVFLEGYQTDPKGPKAPDSLLKLGMSLGGLDKKREACAAFEKLIKDFPSISAGVKNTVTREKQKYGCS